MDLEKESKFQELVEREYLRMALELWREKDIVKGNLADIVFNDVEQPRRKLHHIETMSKLGRPQKLTMRDAYFLAKAVGEEPFALYFRAHESVRTKLKSGLLSLEDEG
jgi:hypothetical protein